MRRSRLLQIEQLESLVLLSASAADCGDTLTGTECDDTFVLNDTVTQIDGRSGFDVLNITDGVASDFDITCLDDGSILLRELNSDRTVKLIDIEQIVFADCEAVTIPAQNVANATQSGAGSTFDADASGAGNPDSPAENGGSGSDGTQLSELEDPGSGTESPADDPTEVELVDPDGPFTITNPGEGTVTEPSEPGGAAGGSSPGSPGEPPTFEPPPIEFPEDVTDPGTTVSSPPIEPVDPPVSDGSATEPAPGSQPDSPSGEDVPGDQPPVDLPTVVEEPAATNEIPEAEFEIQPVAEANEAVSDLFEAAAVEFVESPPEPVADFEPAESTAAPATSVQTTPASDFLQRVLDLTNEIRSQNGLGSLTLNLQLQAAAQLHADNIAAGDFFDHVGLDGSQPWDRAEAAGYDYQAIGENIAAGQLTPEEVVQGWYESAAHRANILNPAFTELGVGYSFLENDTGNVNFNRYWSQLFGTER